MAPNEYAAKMAILLVILTTKTNRPSFFFFFFFILKSWWVVGTHHPPLTSLHQKLFKNLKKRTKRKNLKLSTDGHYLSK
jgi:hypothetical protein